MWKTKSVNIKKKSQQNTFILLMILATFRLHWGIVSCANALFSIQNTTKIRPTLSLAELCYYISLILVEWLQKAFSWHDSSHRCSCCIKHFLKAQTHWVPALCFWACSFHRFQSVLILKREKVSPRISFSVCGEPTKTGPPGCQPALPALRSWPRVSGHLKRAVNKAESFRYTPSGPEDTLPEHR